MNNPRSIKYLIWNEITERYSLYGMRAILIIFMTSHLGICEQSAMRAFHLFIAGCYFFSIIGGIFGDLMSGQKFRLLIFLNVIYFVGHFVMTAADSYFSICSGLFIIALATGIIKPVIISFVSDQFNLPSAQKSYDKAMTFFFFGINIGSFSAIMTTPFILEKYGSRIAFMIPSIAILLSLLLFIIGKKHYITKKNNISGPSLIGSLSLKPASIFIFFFLSIFFLVFDQMSSIVVIQAKKMDQNIFGLSLSPSQVPMINPLIMLFLTPVFSLIYKKIDKYGLNFTISNKIRLGLIFATLAMLILVIIQHSMENLKVGSLPIAWQFAPHVLMTVAEVLIMPSGVVLAYSLAPDQAKCKSISMFFLSICIGNIINSIILSKIQSHFIIFSLSAILCCISYIGITISFKVYNKINNLKI